jgi:hypothetical protein
VNIPSKQTSGFAGGASQAGTISGLPRQIVDHRLSGHGAPENLPKGHSRKYINMA